MTSDPGEPAAADDTAPRGNGNALPGQNSAQPSDIGAVHQNIAFANSYRLELLKLSMAIAAGLLAFTVTFRPTLAPVAWPWAMWLGWAGLAISVIGGMVHMEGWDHYYKSYRDIDWKLRETPAKAKELGDAARRRINGWRRWGMLSQYIGLAVGVLGVGLFAGLNIDNAPARSTPGFASESSVSACCTATSCGVLLSQASLGTGTQSNDNCKGRE